MSNERVWTNKDFPDPPWTKPQVEAWYSTASPGEQKAANQAYIYYRQWRVNPQNSFFGETINPAVCQGKLVEAANKYGAYLPVLSYDYMRGYM